MITALSSAGGEVDALLDAARGRDLRARIVNVQVEKFRSQECPGDVSSCIQPRTVIHDQRADLGGDARGGVRAPPVAGGIHERQDLVVHAQPAVGRQIVVEDRRDAAGRQRG